jgi:SAM-dependent methyltransferase
VLDIGCGTGHNLGRLRRLGVPFESYRGVDLTNSMLAIARQRYADATALRDLPALTTIHPWTAGLVKLVHLRRPDSQSVESGEQTPETEGARSAGAGGGGQTT